MSVHAGPYRACPHEEEAALQLLRQDVLGRQDAAEAHGEAPQPEGRRRAGELSAAQVSLQTTFILSHPLRPERAADTTPSPCPG